MTALILSIIIFSIYLIYERAVLDKRRRTLHKVITVAGTRGKTSVVRMLASVFRENGIRVLAKTTGSQPCYILPDGRETEIKRVGLPSIIEQKKLLKFAYKLKADCLIAEIMSIHPENYFVESQQILKPDIIVITNIGKDHTDAMGKTEEEIASVLSLCITDNSTVFIPENEMYPVFLETIIKKNGKLLKVSSDSQDIKYKIREMEFSENICLVKSVAEYLNIKNELIIRGMQNTGFDIGEFRIWKYRKEDSKKDVFFSNGFAANDPESTLQLIKKIMNFLPDTSDKITGLITLRPDREDRTIQWIDALQNGMSGYFDKIYVTGGHSAAFKRKINLSEIVREKSPVKITEFLIENVNENSVILGFGNISGIGKCLIEYWKTIGEEYGV